tara:strand:- start:81 stop:1277 length:1197 start_codon:yes stop_codon:yes gene_type:complete
MIKFDFCVSNPAFNISEQNNKAGTGGNTTLYKKATNHAFNMLKENGYLINITLKGIISDLLGKKYSKYQTHFINLMDDVDVWPYNTCYFMLQKSAKSKEVKFKGGLASRLYKVKQSQCFPFVYYSGSNNIMKGFTDKGKNKVIRKLPGKNNDDVVYDYTDIEVDSGWKFAFNVMESKKSYYVTNEPIRGGTICYIPTDTKEEAEKLKLFVEKNQVFANYIKRTKLKYHAFGMRNIKRFDLSQIKNGTEVPVEWKLKQEHLKEPKSLLNENEDNIFKVKTQGQVYTPKALVNKVLDDIEKVNPTAFTNPLYTFCDTMCGNGRFLCEILSRKIKNGIEPEVAIKTIYGVELDNESVNECRSNLNKILNTTNSSTITDNIVHSDTFQYDFSFNRTLFEDNA